MTKLAKIIDNFSIQVSVFFILEIWLNRYIGSLLITTLVSALVTLTLFVILKTILSGKELKHIPLSHYYTTLTVLGNDNAVELYKSINPDDNRYIKGILRFTDVTMDDIANVYRESKDKDVLIICKNASRSVQVFANSLPKGFAFLKLKHFTKLLEKNNLLPKILEQDVERKYSFKEVFEGAFSKTNAKYFCLTGAILAITSLFTPFTIYYAVVASLSLLLAIFCLIYGYYN